MDIRLRRRFPDRSDEFSRRRKSHLRRHAEAGTARVDSKEFARCSAALSLGDAESDWRHPLRSCAIVAKKGSRGPSSGCGTICAQQRPTLRRFLESGSATRNHLQCMCGRCQNHRPQGGRRYGRRHEGQGAVPMTLAKKLVLRMLEGLEGGSLELVCQRETYTYGDPG